MVSLVQVQSLSMLGFGSAGLISHNVVTVLSCINCQHQQAGFQDNYDTTAAAPSWW